MPKGRSQRPKALGRPRHEVEDRGQVELTAEEKMFLDALADIILSDFRDALRADRDDEDE